MFEFAERLLKPELRKPYYVTVHRAERPDTAEIYAIDLRDRLPAVNVPLRAPDPDVALDLQPLLVRVHRNGRFPIDYRAPAEPPLADEEAKWAKDIVADQV